MSETSDEIERAKRQGAREALTRLAERRHRAGDAFNAAYYEGLRDSEYPAPRVRAVVRGLADTAWSLYRDIWNPSTSTAHPTREEVVTMYALQQRKRAERAARRKAR